MRKFVVLALLLSALLVTSVAIDQAYAKSGYAQSGCGLGSLLFGSDPGKFKQILAATTNGTFASQTFGISTGTSNCQSPKPGKHAARAFIEANREALAKDIARGSGETVSSLSTIAACSDPMTVSSSLQQEYAQIFPDETATDEAVADAIIALLEKDVMSCELDG